MGKKVCFTVITGGYDTIKSIPEKNKNWDYVCITDMPKQTMNWDYFIHPDTLNPPKDIVDNPILLQRWIKVIGGMQYFKKDTLYIDGKLSMRHNFLDLFCHNPFVSIANQKRHCIYDEGDACKRLNKANKEDIDRQMDDYRMLGVPSNIGMLDTSLMYRAYTPENLHFGNLWWKEISKYTHRDQLSVMKVAWETGTKITTYSYNYSHKYLVKLYHHSRKI